VPTPEEAIRELAAMPDREAPSTTEFPRYFVGAPEELRDKLIDMASQLNLEELMIVTIVHDHRARMRSYELLADAFKLQPRQ
jgi:alkanesulfonate monooxygenase SsuD/methylene tetrahydromethanopterin reductase-like flavin-dependent oxidoreductase (luciferase family)